jgi:hypothetical protein
MISRIIIAVLLTANVAISAPAIAEQRTETKVPPGEVPESSEPEKIIHRGNKIGSKSPVVALEDILKDPKKFENKKVIIEGTVNNVCQKKGCWMEVSAGKDQPGVRVTFKDYGFFVPKDAAGYKVRAEGKVKVATLSEETADHYEEEGAKVVRNDDGTATEIGFVAYGVELYKQD